MFWGLIMEPQRRYTQKVKKAFHISMAALDVSTSSTDAAQVMVGFEGRNYLLCTLRKPDMLQCPLDLNFEVGDELSLAANGSCHVHLTGYLIEDPNEFDFGEEEEDDQEEVSQEKEVKKKNKKRNKLEVENGPPQKKPKPSTNSAQNEDSDDDSDDDDSDIDVNELLNKSLSDDDEDDDTFVSDDAVEEEESANEEEDEEDVDDEAEEDEESSLSEEDTDETVQIKPTMNGTPNKLANKQKEKKDQKNEQKKKQKEVKSPNKENQSPKVKEPSNKKVLQNGLIIEDLKEGQGQPAKAGKYISVYYEGRLKSNNKVFDSTKQGAGFSFRLGGGEVIKGWDAGLVGMKLGGKRRITCPPNMAYGYKGSPPAIPANSTLIFEVELKKIR